MYPMEGIWEAMLFETGMVAVPVVEVNQYEGARWYVEVEVELTIEGIRGNGTEDFSQVAKVEGEINLVPIDDQYRQVISSVQGTTNRSQSVSIDHGPAAEVELSGGLGDAKIRRTASETPSTGW